MRAIAIVAAVVGVSALAHAQGASVSRSLRSGTLTGKTVYVSAGHGWYWSEALGRWTTQRGNTNGLVEDLVSAETVSQELIDELERMGAYVVPVRESDMQPAMTIVDDADAGFFVSSMSPLLTPVAAGWHHVAAPIVDASNPFAGGGSRIGGIGARATWSFQVPTDGDYDVYVSWVADPSRVSSADYFVTYYTGDSAAFVVDQRRHGGTWVRLGRFPFLADRGGRVELFGGADQGPNQTASFDAVRVGGGTSHIARGPAPITSERPAYEDAARYAAQWNGAPASVWDGSTSDDSDDVGARARFAAWDHADGEDAIYVAWHTNAPSPARGTTSFAYGPKAYGTLADFTGVPGSLALLDAVHGELIADLRADWDASWEDRGEHTADFGEVNPTNNAETPAILVEVAFHDTLADADALREPRFRRIAARAMAQGIARYFAAKDARALVLPPEPPTGLRATADDGTITWSWDPPRADAAGGDPATHYRVYLSQDGRGTWTVSGSEDPRFVLGDGRTMFARVTAVNDGGESRPTPVIGAADAAGRAKVLVVAGYDALDATLLDHEDLSARGLGVVDRAREDRINDGSYVGRHGLAIAAAGRNFDSATRAGLASIDLSRYAAIDWLAGRDPAPWTDAERAAIAGYLAAGGRVIGSGTDLARTADAPSLATLGATFTAETEIDATITGDAGAPFDGLALALSRTGWGDYDPAAPDVLAPADDGAAPAFSFAGATVATWRPHAAIVLGFPFESIAGAGARAEVMRRALDGLDVPADVTAPPGGGGGCACATGATPSPPSPVVLLAFAFAWRRRPARRRA